MKIAHVVTYISPDGAFGGPVRVALGQAQALAERGHEVSVFAAAPRDLATEDFRDGYRLRTFPGARLMRHGGFASMMSRDLIRALRAELPTFDVVHVHLARDLVTLPAAAIARRSGVPYVLQPHGMVDASRRLLARPLDAFATRPILRDARTVLALTDQEVDDLRGVEPRAALHRISNGVRMRELPAYEGRPNRVLFLARLQARKRPVAFVEMAALLRHEFPDTEFVLVGPDEGEAGSVQETIGRLSLQNRVRWVGPASPDETDMWLSNALVFVLPSLGEVFPMTILESFREGTPVVATDSLGIAEACIKHNAALITDGSPAALANAVGRLLRDRPACEELRSGGFALLRSELDIGRVAMELERVYAEAAF